MAHTVATNVHVYHIADSHVDDAEKSLVLLFEFLLVEDLNGEDAVFRRFPAILSAIVYWTHISSCSYISKTSFQ